MTTIREYLNTHPDSSDTDVARALGVSRHSVRTIRCEIKSGLRRVYRLSHLVSERPKLARWLREQCPDGVTMGEFIVAVLEDARHADEERS